MNIGAVSVRAFARRLAAQAAFELDILFLLDNLRRQAQRTDQPQMRTLCRQHPDRTGIRTRQLDHGAQKTLKQRFQIKDRLPAMTIPMQMVWGEKDAFAPVDFAHGLMKLLPNVRIDILSNAGHQAQTDAPDEVNKLVLDFLLGKSA